MIRFLITLAGGLVLTSCGPSTDDAVKADAPQDVETVAEAPPLLAGAKMARCEIKPNRYSGPCMFLAEKNGSFSVQMRDRSPLYPDVSVVTVSVTEPGKAQVFGLTTSGNNSRWGEATRSADDKACWVGSDFEVCAY